jgi:crotonobetainyl-CoA:carnitine CoA-transferase CaiB-like acyl-CoA transferase
MADPVDLCLRPAMSGGVSRSGPCAGLNLVEVVAGTSELGLGLAGGLPGMMLADLGAEVVRVVDRTPQGLDESLTWGRAWHRDKRIVATDDVDEIGRLLAGADVALVYGAEELVEGRGLGFRDLQRTNPGLVYGRCRPSRTAAGAVEDYGLLVEAKAGFCTQLAGHREGPIFVDVRAPGAGAAFLLTTSVLALLRRRTISGGGQGGWAETSLYDGMLATLGCMIGRSERAAPEIEGYWTHGSTYPNFLYRCSDDELIQVWFGGKGMYPKLIDVLGDEPSEAGYYQDQATGALGVRAQRWRPIFATRPRDEWIEELRAVGVACEPVNAPGEALADPHVHTLTRTDQGATDVLLATPISVTPVAGPVLPTPPTPRGGLLEGVKVLDFSAFVAGPLAAEVLADLGAEVVKVEPPEGEAMRGAAYALAACQRGKRSLGMNLAAPETRPVVERLIRWADVVLHNFRVGVSERLGIDEATVAELNPGAVYCHAAAFGTTGPRVKAPGNDALMQALTGFEWANGGEGNDPIGGTWIPLDMTGGWIAATGTLAALYARAATGQGQQAVTSLLGAAMLLHSGVYERDGEIARGPELDGQQTGYGAGYRIYQGSDGEWFALVVPHPDAWACLGTVVYEQLGEYTPLGRSEAETRLERAFATRPAAEWVKELRQHDLLVEPITPTGRDAFRQGILDDPVNRQLGRVASYETADWGHFEQIGPLLRCGPDADGGPPLMLPAAGEHSVEVLIDLGFTDEEVDALLAAQVVRQS